MVNHIMFPNSNAKMKTLTRSFNGAGYGSVLLDGGIGGQSSYHSIDDYMQTTGRQIPVPKGMGLADKIGSKLQKMEISKPKKKNIVLSL